MLFNGLYWLLIFVIHEFWNYLTIFCHLTISYINGKYPSHPKYLYTFMSIYNFYKVIILKNMAPRCVNGIVTHEQTWKCFFFCYQKWFWTDTCIFKFIFLFFWKWCVFFCFYFILYFYIYQGSFIPGSNMVFLAILVGQHGNMPISS